MMMMMMMMQVLAVRLMQAIVPSVENIKDLDAAEELVDELFRALGAVLTTCQNDPTLIYTGTYFSCVVNGNCSTKYSSHSYCTD